MPQLQSLVDMRAHHLDQGSSNNCDSNTDNSNSNYIILILRIDINNNHILLIQVPDIMTAIIVVTNTQFAD